MWSAAGGDEELFTKHTQKKKIYQNIIKHNGLVSFDFFNDSQARKENHSHSIRQTCVCALSMCSKHPQATQCRVASYLTVARSTVCNAAEWYTRSPHREIHSRDCGHIIYTLRLYGCDGRHKFEMQRKNHALCVFVSLIEQASAVINRIDIDFACVLFNCLTARYFSFDFCMSFF